MPFWKMTTIGVIALLASGCQWMAPKTQPGHIDVDSADRTTLQDEYGRLRTYADGMEEKLRASELERTKQKAEVETLKESNRLLKDELDATKVDLEYLESQFITIERHFSKDETKATAVAALADAQLLYQKLRKEDPADFPEQVWTEVDHRLTSADDAMSHSNYTAAAYHAHRAIRLLNHAEKRVSSFFAGGEAHVVSVQVANLRKGPSSDEIVLTQLPYGTVLVEVGKKGEWRHVKTRSGPEGWVHTSVIQ